MGCRPPHHPRHSRQINNLRDEIPHPRPALAHISGGANFAPTQSSRLSR